MRKVVGEGGALRYRCSESSEAGSRSGRAQIKRPDIPGFLLEANDHWGRSGMSTLTPSTILQVHGPCRNLKAREENCNITYTLSHTLRTREWYPLTGRREADREPLVRHKYVSSAKRQGKKNRKKIS